MKPVKQHSNRYLTYIRSKEWYAKTKKIHRMTKNRCVLFPWLKSRECHHLHYRNLENELAFRDCVPLSKTAHNIIHLYPLWKIKPITRVINQLLRLLFVIGCILALFRK